MAGKPAKTALVTGVTHGLGPGFAAARQLAQQGHHVIVSAPRRGAAEVLAARLRSEGFAASPMRLDLDDVDTFPVIAAELAARFGRLDAFVNTLDGDGSGELALALRPLLEGGTSRGWRSSVESAHAKEYGSGRF